ncbi:hypothetical protein JCM19235_1610 [Vibrio maritimus]|uniref:DUF1640 domain-containing protein n=1 Tax=Vibrio maritimus TaxID=990268 RepID=A0A090S4N2_9VIBR|nr:hypothetical protein JCM19235_1610 [Vibrio maritimus]
MQKIELFNTHSFIKELTSAGMDEKQAEVLADHQLALLETQIANKADMVDVKEHVSSELSLIKEDLDWLNWALLFSSFVTWLASLKFVFN